MDNIYTILTPQEGNKSRLSVNEKFAVKYHNLFDYPLSFAELIKWRFSDVILPTKDTVSVTSKKGFYYLEGREGLIYKRLLRKRISAKKFLLAKKASRVLSILPTIKMIAVTGSLAMENSAEDSDIDLIIITKQGALWSTRFIVYSLLLATGYILRKPKVKSERDALCLNMWIDESDLSWLKKDRNLYSAHEIAQIIPTVNKDKAYENFLFKNKWILNFWPNSIRVSEKLKVKNEKVFRYSYLDFPLRILEKLAYRLQKFYMKKKVTRELVTPTRALFHPQDWGKIVLQRLTT